MHYSFMGISPEGCASILWKTSEKAEEAAEALGITAHRLKALGVIDKIVNEPVGGAHRDHKQMAAFLKRALNDAFRQVSDLKVKELLDRRYERLQSYGRYTDTKPTPKSGRGRRRNGRRTDHPIPLTALNSFYRLPIGVAFSAALTQRPVRRRAGWTGAVTRYTYTRPAARLDDLTHCEEPARASCAIAGGAWTPAMRMPAEDDASLAFMRPGEAPQRGPQPCCWTTRRRSVETSAGAETRAVCRPEGGRFIRTRRHGFSSASAASA